MIKYCAVKMTAFVSCFCIFAGSLKCPQTGVSTEDGEPTAASWKWYTAMDEAIGGRPLRGRRGCGEKWRKTRTEENGRDKREERQEREVRERK